MKKINYTGSSKIIKHLCDNVNELIDEGGGSNVSITPSLTSGVKIADYEIDGQTGSLYAPSYTNYDNQEF